MPAPPLVIVGGGPAGFAVASAYREAGGRDPVVMLAAEPVPPYRRPPLTKGFLRGRETEDALPLEARDWYSAHDIDLRLSTAATALDPEARTLVTDAGEELAYGECVLCTGSEPSRPPVPGVALPGVHVVRTVSDSARLGAAIRTGTRVAVVGSGFIGCEAAVSLAMRGAVVQVVTNEEVPQVGRLGAGVGLRVTAWLHEAGVEVLTGRSLASIAPEAGALDVALDQGGLHCDQVLLAVGASARTGLAERAGLPVAEGAVVVDASMRSAVEGVSCAGDVAYAMNATAGRRLRVEHWGEALRQGAVAGRRLAGGDAVWGDVPGFWSTIGHRTLKQAAWGDGWDETTLDSDAAGFTAWYGREGRIVGVLTHGRDHDYEVGSRRVREGASWPPG